MASISYLEHLLIYLCKRMAGHQVAITLPIRLPGDGGLSLGLLWHVRLINKCGTNGQVQLHNGFSATLCIRKGYKDQGLTKLPIVPIICGSGPIVVILCIFHMTTKPILNIGAHYLDSVVQISFRHIQPVSTSRAVRQGKQGVWFWAGEMRLGKQAG